MAVLAHFFEIAPKPNQPPILLFRRVVFIFCAHIGKLYDPKNGKLYDPKKWKNYMILKMENYMIQKKMEKLYDPKNGKLYDPKNGKSIWIQSLGGRASFCSDHVYHWPDKWIQSLDIRWCKAEQASEALLKPR